ncbi:hypothetical protein KK083_14730 [Fulvivirgaceae bacterium PWU4]|uniref:Uncharacterized protein n=1 Tax=Chryseosolibacter histidini TaxID=2782349 RepID=A0AAP2DKR7_9BACT|nr:hypothetical protein [Chryseosolibacter histidini]MBT1698145.1 hypothetical protein [Chryseosolibacter histidini]
MVDFILVVLKYAATLLSGFFGVYGLLLDFKDKDGKITKAGRFALYVIIISGVIALVTQSIELYIDNQKSISDGQRILAQLDQNTKVLNGLDRTLNPIEDLTVSYDVIIPSNHTRLKSYTSSLFKNLHELLDTMKYNASLQSRLWRHGILASRVAGMEHIPTIEEVELSRQCWLLPHRNEFTHTILAYSDVDLVFFRNPLPIDSLRKIRFSAYSSGDLSMSLTSGLIPQGLSGEHTITVDFPQNTIALKARNLRSDPQYWLNNGRVLSIPDLLGCQLILHLPGIMDSGNEEHDQYLRDVRKDFELHDLEISMSKGRRYWIHRDQLTKIESSDGMPTYVFQFPSTDEELWRMDILR